MIIRTQIKDMIVNSAQSSALFVEKDVENNDYDIKAALNLDRKIVILGTYKDEKVAQNVIEQIFKASATKQPTFQMPEDTSNKDVKLIRTLSTNAGTNTIRFADGIEVETDKKMIESFNAIEVEAGTTGFRGGDSGHGGRTYFRIKDTACTDIQVNVIKPRKNEHDNDGGFEVLLGGDSELTTIIAFKLESESHKESD